ncbi:MAG: hypothetical protein JSS35_09660, partial [Proteobacteria bacterium]|nr:hypothetical protein [Pseudomonadota bacterium]
MSGRGNSGPGRDEPGQSLPEQVAGAAVEAVRRVPLRTRLAIVMISVAAALVALVAGLRYGVLLPQARLGIEAAADGLKVGRFGRLRVEGLSGDIFRDLRVA